MNYDDEPEIEIDDIEDDQDLVIDDEPGEEEPEVSFEGDEPEDDGAADLPKRLRSEIKERDRELVLRNQRIAELEKKTAPVAVEVGPKPKLEAFDYDEDKWDAAVEEWSDNKVAAALQKREAVADDGLLEEAQTDVTNYQDGIRSLAFADAKEVTEAVSQALPVNLQYVIAAVANDPATLTYALGKHPARLAEVLAIKNPTKQIAAIVRMEASMKVGQSRKAPEPDRPSKGNASAAVKADKELARLEAEAEKNGGDRSAIAAYKLAQRKA